MAETFDVLDHWSGEPVIDADLVDQLLDRLRFWAGKSMICDLNAGEADRVCELFRTLDKELSHPDGDVPTDWAQAILGDEDVDGVEEKPDPGRFIGIKITHAMISPPPMVKIMGTADNLLIEERDRLAAWLGESGRTGCDCAACVEVRKTHHAIVRRLDRRAKAGFTVDMDEEPPTEAQPESTDEMEQTLVVESIEPGSATALRIPPRSQQEYRPPRLSDYLKESQQ